METKTITKQINKNGNKKVIKLLKNQILKLKTWRWLKRYKSDEVKDWQISQDDYEYRPF